MADEEDFSKLPFPDRFAHKNWKVRKEGYEAAAKEFDTAQTEQDPLVRQFIQDAGLWKGAVADSNVAAQQEGMGALIAFLNIAGPEGCKRYVAAKLKRESYGMRADRKLLGHEGPLLLHLSRKVWVLLAPRPSRKLWRL
jgi:hypothetical protein